MYLHGGSALRLTTPLRLGVGSGARSVSGSRRWYMSELTVAAPGFVASLASVAVPGLCSCRHVTRLLNRGHSF